MAFKVQIVNVSDNANNIILVSGLTIETLKIKYNWILNASVKNCILGEDGNGIVWYSGEWICGEWINGTWYSGIWHDGIWDNGQWYSYLIDTSMIISNRFVILDKNSTYSEFRSGIWKQGDFYDGTFGYDRDISNKYYSELTGRTFGCAYWNTGKFHNGIFKNSVWSDGLFYAGDMSNSYWLYGKFYSGTFNKYRWYNGLWYGGDFIEGDWYNGSFDQINSSIKSRFGLANLEKSRTNWNGGTFYKGEFYSGLNLDFSGNTIPSIDSNKTHWLSGHFKGGIWYGGHFHNGYFDNGTWYGGVFNTDTGVTHVSDCIWNNGKWYGGLWINGTFNNGHFYDGMWIDGLFVNGYLSTNTVEGVLLKQILATNVVVPSVITNSATTITYNTCIGNGRVTNNGGATILDRGVCWDIFHNPVTGGTNSISDGGSMGNMSIPVSSLSSGTQYYMRAYARNITGLTYGNEVTFTTIGSLAGVPQLTVTPDPIVTSTIANVYGYVTSNQGSNITYCGFYYSDTNTDPGPSNIDIVTSIPVGPGGVGQFNATLTGLTANGITYWYKPYAINNTGIGYGQPSTKQFVTGPSITPVPPTVSTVLIDTIADTSAITYGTVSDNGNAIITAVGACWSTSPGPTIAGTHTTEQGTMNSFSTTMTGLLPNTVYYVRAYATNSVGTSYGAELTVRTTVLRSFPTVRITGCSAV